MIRRNPVALPAIFAVCFALASGGGCDRNPAAPVQATTARPTPEQSFKEIVQMVKDGIELPGTGAVSGFVTQNPRASSRFQVHNSVTSQIIPPANPGESYHGIITLTSRSVYSLRRSAEEADKKDEEVEKRNGFSLMDNLDESSSGFEVLDDQLVSGSNVDEKVEKKEIERVQRHSDTEVRAYDFAYENSRWVLKSKFDPEAEKSIASAVERALRLQP